MKLIKLPFKVKRPVLACGADMKGAFALAKGGEAYLFDGFGDLSDLDNFLRYEKAVNGAVKKLEIIPRFIACDLHPEYFSTKFAQRHGPWTMDHGPSMIQHHEAHVASAIVDNNIRGKIFAAAFDGTGYGADGNIWGGEFFTGDLKSLKRIGHIDYIPMPGGDMAIREPWRMAASYLYAAYGKVKRFDVKRWSIIKDMIDKGINAPLTSGMGRLFDAVACLVLKKNEAEFEAELPIKLEKMADPDIDGYYGFARTTDIIKGVVRDLDKRIAASAVSAKFHNTIAHMILKRARQAKIRQVVLTGGVFQNRFLSNRAVALLNKNGFMACTHSNIETNDSGIPIGQIAIANARASCV